MSLQRPHNNASLIMGGFQTLKGGLDAVAPKIEAHQEANRPLTEYEQYEAQQRMADLDMNSPKALAFKVRTGQMSRQEAEAILQNGGAPQGQPQPRPPSGAEMTAQGVTGSAEVSSMMQPSAQPVPGGEGGLSAAAMEMANRPIPAQLEPPPGVSAPSSGGGLAAPPPQLPQAPAPQQAQGPRLPPMPKTRKDLDALRGWHEGKSRIEGMKAQSSYHRTMAAQQEQNRRAQLASDTRKAIANGNNSAKVAIAQYLEDGRTDRFADTVLLKERELDIMERRASAFEQQVTQTGTNNNMRAAIESTRTRFLHAKTKYESAVKAMTSDKMFALDPEALQRQIDSIVAAEQEMTTAVQFMDQLANMGGMQAPIPPAQVQVGPVTATIPQQQPGGGGTAPAGGVTTRTTTTKSSSGVKPKIPTSTPVKAPPNPAAATGTSPSGNTSPGGKPYTKKMYSASTKTTYYVNGSTVVEAVPDAQ